MLTRAVAKGTGLLLVLTLLVLTPTGCGVPDVPQTRQAKEFGQANDPGRANGPGQPNVLLVMTDDQPYRTFSERLMPKTYKALAREGITFQNAFISDPLCCPSRATILTGKYTHNHHLTSNAPPDGGAPGFRERGLDRYTLATRLSPEGYETAYFGKYLNSFSGTYVPPGWDRFFAFSGDISKPNSYDVNDQGRMRTFDRLKTNDTDLLADKAVGFLENHKEDPWFLMVGTHAPHGPPRVPNRHRYDFDGVNLPKTPNFNAKNVSDKPEPYRARPLSRAEIADLRADYEGRLEALQAVDDLVGDLSQALRRTDQAQKTYVVFLTDNPYMMGEHRLTDKGKPYEESIRTPLLVRGPGVPAGETRTQLVSNVDLAPTIAAWADADSSGYDGRSLSPLLSASPPSAWRESLLIEHFTGASWTGLRTRRYAYIEHHTGNKELYDLEEDPYQLENIHGSADPLLLADLQDRLEVLKGCSSGACRTAENEIP